MPVRKVRDPEMALSQGGRQAGTQGMKENVSMRKAGRENMGSSNTGLQSQRRQACGRLLYR